MSCPNCEQYADYQAQLEAEAEAQYYAGYLGYLDHLIETKRYDLYAFEIVGDAIYSKLSKEDKKIFLKAKQEIEDRYNNEDNIIKSEWESDL